MMMQFYKAQIFEPEVDNFVNVVTIENEDQEDSKITLDLPMEIEKGMVR